MKAPKLPAFGWCTVVVSEVSDAATRKALCLKAVDPEAEDAVETWLVRRNGVGNYLRYFRKFGDAEIHPRYVASQLLRVLSAHRDPYPKWMTKSDRSKCKPVHGLILQTKQFPPLDLIWLIRILKEARAKEKSTRSKRYQELMRKFSAMFNATPAVPLSFFSWLVEQKFSVFYINDRGVVKDISRLDPGSEDEDESTWGRLSDFVNLAGNLCGEAINRYDLRE